MNAFTKMGNKLDQLILTDEEKKDLENQREEEENKEEIKEVQFNNQRRGGSVKIQNN